MAEAASSSICPEFGSGPLHIPLAKCNVRDIANELSTVAYNWAVVGTCLGVDDSEIKEIETQRLLPKRALIELITRWLSTNHNVTWNDIVRALRMPLLKEESLAKKIEEKALSRTLFKSVSSPSQVEEDSASMDYLRSESSPALVQSTSSAPLSSTSSQQPDSSCSPSVSSNTPIQEEGSDPPSVCDTSVPNRSQSSNQLLSTASQTNENDHPSKELSTEEGRAKSPYSCGCGECPASEFFSGNCPNPLPTESKFPYLNTSGLSEEEREELKFRLREDFRNINRRYAKLTASLRRSLRGQNITPEDLADSLMDLRGLQPIKNTSEESVGLLQDRYSEIKSAKGVTEVFEILSADYCSFFNYEIVEFIVDLLGTESDKKNLADYESSLEDYCKRHVFECPCYSSKSSKLPDLVLKLDESTIGEFTLTSLRSFSNKVAQVLKVTKYALKVCGIKEGCLEITFQIPSHIKEAIFPLTSDQEKALHLLGVKKIVCDEKQFFLSPEETFGIVPKSLASGEQRRTLPALSATPSPATLQGASIPSETVSPESKVLTQAIKSPTASSHAPHSRGCMKHKLLKKCHFGDRCRYVHSDYTASFRPTVGYIPIPRSTSSSTLRRFLDKVDLTPTGKGFIAVESDRAHGSPEIKIVAEDLDTLEFAKETVLKKLSSLPGQEVQRPRECVKYKLLGKCEYDPCQYIHGDIVESPSIGYVAHPVGKIPNIKRAVGHVGYIKLRGEFYAYITALSDRDRQKEVKVIAENDEALYEAKKKVEIFFGQTHSVYSNVTAVSLALCYVEPKGLETDFQLKMQLNPGGGGKHQYTLERTRSEKAALSTAVKTLSVKEFEHLNKELPHSVGYMLDHPEETLNMEVSQSYPAQVRLLSDYRGQIHKLLRETMQWMHHEQLHPKLEGRFGRLEWVRIPPFLQRGQLDVKGFINFISTNSNHKRFFRPRLDETDILQAIKSLTVLDSVVETYDLKISVENKGKVDIRLKFFDGKPQIIAVRKDEEKLLIADVLCLHRKHDLRLSLSSYGVIPHDDPTVQKFVQAVTLEEPGILTFLPQAEDKEWTTRIVRHKKRRAYLYGEKNYLVTVSKINSYNVQSSDLTPLKPTSITLAGNDWRQHHEIEIHNLNWEIDFGRQLDLTPEQSLSLLMDPDKIPSHLLTSTRPPWTPDSIMADFERDEFLQMMDDINKGMEVSVKA